MILEFYCVAFRSPLPVSKHGHFDYLIPEFTGQKNLLPFLTWRKLGTIHGIPLSLRKAQRTKSQNTTCVIIGGGPAGMIAGLILPRADVADPVLGKRGQF